MNTKNIYDSKDKEQSIYKIPNSQENVTNNFSSKTTTETVKNFSNISLKTFTSTSLIKINTVRQNGEYYQRLIVILKNSYNF